MAELGAELGSDVPFFLSGAAAGVATGRGERVEPVAAGRRWWAVVAKPPVGLSTAAVFAAWGGRGTAAATGGAARAFTSGGTGLPGRLANDLDGPAGEAEPVLAAERAAFIAVGLRHSCLSGSGTSRFALLPTAAAARSAAAKLRRRRPGPVAAVPLAV